MVVDASVWVSRLVPQDVHHAATREARLAADLALRGADAVYVATADHLSLPLITWDEEQRDRANRLITVRSPLPG